MNKLLRFAFSIALAFPLISPASATAQTITMKLGTAAPDGSLWWKVLDRMAQRWRDETKQETVKVDLHILPGGTQGDEGKLLDRLKFGQLQVIAISGVGLAAKAPGVTAIQMPMLVDSWAGLDRVRAGLEPRLEKTLADQGLVVLNWSDVGWVHFVTKSKARTPADLKNLKLFITSGDLDSEKLYRDMGFKPVPIAVTDLLTSLKTGLIEAFDVPPLFAWANQSFGLTQYMIELKWAPVIGATVVDKKTWERIPQPLRDRLMKIARDTGEELRADIRAQEDGAVRNMQKLGLVVLTPTPEELQQWRTTAKTAREKLKGGLIPVDFFDEAVRLAGLPEPPARPAR